ncbi:Uncharacterised protein [Mycobacteroides abscessus subsp. abscessus]|nr:Uncharacterised protein [Mycobacteroides abscessus subsp. abscessus]
MLFGRDIAAAGNLHLPFTQFRKAAIAQIKQKTRTMEQKWMLFFIKRMGSYGNLCADAGWIQRPDGKAIIFDGAENAVLGCAGFRT